jgi:GTP-binding protein
VKNYLAIRSELESYSPDLATRDEIVLVSKSELPGSEATKGLLEDAIGREVRLVSAVTGDGLVPLMHEIMERLVQWRKLQDVAPTSMPWENPADVAAKAEAPSEPEQEPVKLRRVPPHLAGLTASLSNDNQPRDFDGEKR